MTITISWKVHNRLGLILRRIGMRRLGCWGDLWRRIRKRVYIHNNHHIHNHPNHGDRHSSKLKLTNTPLQLLCMLLVVHHSLLTLTTLLCLRNLLKIRSISTLWNLVTNLHHRVNSRNETKFKLYYTAYI